MRPVNPDERPLGQPLIAGEPVVVKPREKSAFELAAERPVRGLSRGAPPPVPNLLASVAAGAVSFRASSFAEKCAAEIGLLDVLRELQAKAAQRYAIDPRALSAVRGRSFQITARTPLGFVHAPGDISWPPNQSLGRNLGLYMARTLTLKPGRSPAVIKVKGAGQAFDHPGEQRQQINQRSRPPLPYPLLWDRAYHKTGTVQFGLQRELAEHELKQILVVHALSKRVFGHLANVPTPLDVVPVEHVEIGGKKVSLVRARSDRSLWGGHEEYFDRDLQDVHQRLSEIHHPLLSEGPVSPQQLAQAFTESFPLAQLVLLERGQYRNNIGAVIRDPHVAEDSSRVLDEVLTQMLWAQGIAYDPPRGVDRSSYYEYHRAAAAPYQAHLTKALFHEARVMGRLYGMIRAFGADTKDGFHPKDSVGSEVTDWSDYDMPQPNSREDVHLGPLTSWTGYQGGLDHNLQSLAQLYGLEWRVGREAEEVWHAAAQEAAVAVARAGLDGRLDDLLGPAKHEWREWILRELAEGTPGGDTMRDALAVLR